MDWRGLLRSRPLTRGIASALVFAFVATLLSIWTHGSPLVGEGRVMSDTRSVRVKFERVDEVATATRRDIARRSTPWVFEAQQERIDRIKNSLEELPVALADAESLDDVTPALRQSFGLKAEWVEEIRALALEGAAIGSWLDVLTRLDKRLVETPIIDQGSYEAMVADGVNRIELRSDGVQRAVLSMQGALVQGGASFEEQLRRVVGAGGIGQPGLGLKGAMLEVVVARVLYEQEPIYELDRGATAAAQELSAENEPETLVSFQPGQVIFQRGDELDAQQLALFRDELSEYRKQTPVRWRSAYILGITGMMTGIALAGVAYVAAFCPRIRRNPMRGAAIAALFIATLALSCATAVNQPGMIALAVTAPPIFVAVICTIAYEQRVGLAFGLLHAITVAIATLQPASWMVVVAIGIGAAVWQLDEIRDRNALIRVGVAVGVLTALGALAAGFADLPLSLAAIRQIAWDSGLTGFGGLLVGGITLFILPTVERTFDITTGMTLIELRDPKQPLLRQLQQRAPGTYNHSLNVATLGEAAADSIGANGLLTYVGALYHDIGKMNKPEYFVENQVPGENKHDKLSPAMSLLIIVGHVKDGLELAREFDLPRPLHHFIEGHHGTTLVEYFYHRAKQKAEEEGEETGEVVTMPTDLDYRYPGPKPRTKEVAILMLCDAVESASRTIADPTPSRIDAFVREIANKRLMDGQFDDCDLSLRELTAITEAISKSLAAIYHGRITYPSQKKDEDGVHDPEQPELDGQRAEPEHRTHTKSA